MKPTSVFLAALTAMMAGVALAVWQFTPNPAKPEGTTQFYAIKLKNSKGEELSFHTLRGKKVVINFWASWCAPCIEEMPELDQVSQLVKTKNTEFLGIALDSEANVKQFALKHPVSYTLVAAGFAGAEIAHTFGNTAGVLPFTVLIDESGTVLHSKIGKINQAELKSWLNF